jgi:hypothetical protein
LVESGSAADFEQSIGLPRALAGLVDFLAGFVDPADEIYRAKPAQWLETIPPGADLSGAPAAYVVSLFRDDPGALLTPDLDPAISAFVRSILDVHQAAAAGQISDGARLRSLRREAVRFSNARAASAAPRDPNDLALRAAESAAWPIAQSVSAIVDVLRVHLNSSVETFGAAAKRLVNWSDADDRLIESYYAQIREMNAAGDANADNLAKTPPYADSLGRLQQARSVFDANKGRMMQPYWDRLLAVSRNLAPAR